MNLSSNFKFGIYKLSYFSADVNEFKPKIDAKIINSCLIQVIDSGDSVSMRLSKRYSFRCIDYCRIGDITSYCKGYWLHGSSHSGLS